MNHFRHPPGLDPFASALDAVMADIAISVQLPPGLHAKAGGRYEAIRDFAERPGSPLNGRILRFYPQGSMAIDATTSTRGTDDEYDLDIVAALDLDPHSGPDAVLDLLYRSLEGYPTGQKVERQTRCVTVRYADRMHVDVTPAVRLGHGAERVSHIFHAHPDKPVSEHFHVPMNAYGFAEWYRARTPLERRFAAAFNKRLHEAYGMEVRADAEVDEILDQVPIIVKAVATVALQLLKRHRNVAYAGATGRIPPSVMLSCFAGQASHPGLPLADMVIRLARSVASALRAASVRREPIRVVNPVHAEDCFTDRWPENLAQQDAYAAKLTDLADGLAWIKQHGSSLEDIQDWLRERFGGHVVSTSVRRFNDRTGRAVQSGLHAYTPRGGLYVPSRPALVGVGGAAAAAPARASAHTFRGGAPVVSVFPSIADQDRAIRASWPSFRLVERSERAATWLGTLKPFMLAYEVRVSYQVPLVIERIAPLRQQPEVRVISPVLRRRPGDGEGTLPHVYVDRAGDPVLCLFDHEIGEWTPFSLIAETTIPWALDWLGCYEGWRATGRWSGGGRHAEPPAAKEAGR